MPREYPLTVEQTQDLLAKYGSPLQIYDQDGIQEHVKSFLTVFRKKFPEFQEYYAVKALPNPHILKALYEAGCKFDCSSRSELMICQILGVSGNEIMFTSNYTSKEDLKLALDMGVIINLDDVSLLSTLLEIGTPYCLSFRLNPGMGKTESSTESNVLGGKDAKFGIPIDQIEEIYIEAQKAGIKKLGIHMMAGSCVMNYKYWEELIDIITSVIHRLYSKYGIKIEFLNLGGGIGIPYLPEEKEIDIDHLANTIHTRLISNLEMYYLPKPDIMMENGRYITGSFGWLVSTCQAVKDTYQTYYGLDACMSNLMRPGMYQAYHEIEVLTGNSSAPKKPANVVGTLCENNDWFAKQRMLPPAKVGDIFVIHDTGAHSHSMGFQYNGKLRAPEVVLLTDETGKRTDKLIRKRETLDDYLSTVIKF